jgi:Fic family protein
MDPVLKSAIAHFWFVTIHPFDDGNGRIARAIADLQLARSDNSTQRFYSMSGQIRKERKQYYEILEKTQKSNLDITEWLLWFFDCLKGAIANSEKNLKDILDKAGFWERHANIVLNERQKIMINRLLDGFQGKLNSGKWATTTKVSHDTALRDINDLLQRGILVKEAGGSKNTSYVLRTDF